MSARNLTVEEPRPRRPTALLVLLGLTVAAIVAAQDYFMVVAIYAAALLPLVGPILHRSLHRGARSIEADVDIVDRALVWHTGKRERRVGRGGTRGSATLNGMGCPTIVLSIVDGPTVVLSLPDQRARREALDALGYSVGRAGTLRFLTAERQRPWALLVRALPLVATVVADLAVGAGWSTYLALFPPFWIAMLVAAGVALAELSSPALELREDALFLGSERVAEVGAIRSVKSDATSVTVWFVEGTEERKRRFELAHGHEWQARALHKCIVKARPKVGKPGMYR